MTEYSFTPGDTLGRVLIVDDEKLNRDILRDSLMACGHLVAEAEDGAEAVRVAAEFDPDVVLMDLMMPVMDGIAACRELKRNPNTAPIPVIVVTALSEREARLSAMDAGANDFLNKPIDLPEVVLRVRNAVHLKQLYNQLQQSYVKLEEMERLRDNLTHMIVHDMRSPLTGILGFLDILQITISDKLSESEQESMGHLERSAAGLADMVSSILDISRMEAGEMPLELVRCDLGEIARAALDPLRSLVQEPRLTLEVPVNISGFCDPEIMRRVIANLAGNAMKFTPRQGEVSVRILSRDAFMRIEVSDNGPGIALKDQARIFEKFGQVQDKKKSLGSGIGLTFCKLAVEAHGGQIGVMSDPGMGSTFWVEIPFESTKATTLHST